MSGPRDMTVTNWARTVKRLRRYMEELRRYGCEVKEPESFEIPPDRRIASTLPPLP